MTQMRSKERDPIPPMRQFLKGAMQAKRPWRRIILHDSYEIYWNRPMLNGRKHPECYHSKPGSSGVMFEEIILGIQN